MGRADDEFQPGEVDSVCGCGSIAWVKRRELAATIAGSWWPGLVLMGLALLLHVFGFLAQQPRVSIVALFFGIYSLVGMVWGWKTMRASFFPFCIVRLLHAVWEFVDGLTMPLRLLVTKVTAWICGCVLGIPV